MYCYRLSTNLYSYSRRVRVICLLAPGCWACVDLDQSSPIDQQVPFLQAPPIYVGLQSVEFHNIYAHEKTFTRKTHIHFRFHHRINKLQLALGDLNDLLNQPCPNLIFHVVDSIKTYISDLCSRPWMRREAAILTARFPMVAQLPIESSFHHQAV